jgi:hypothetical protein
MPSATSWSSLNHFVNMGRFGGGDALGGAGEVAKVSHRFQPGKTLNLVARRFFCWRVTSRPHLQRTLLRLRGTG